MKFSSITVITEFLNNILQQPVYNDTLNVVYGMQETTNVYFVTNLNFLRLKLDSTDATVQGFSIRRPNGTLGKRHVL